MVGEAAPLVTMAIKDYMLTSEHKAGFKSARTRLSHVVGYIAKENPKLTVPMINERWIDGFRAYMKSHGYALGHIEGCVLQFAAAINAVPGHQARFKSRSVKDAAQTPVYRANIETIAEMFRFCIDPPPPDGRQWTEKERHMVIGRRVNLLRYLRAAVATWARPDAISGLKARGQWHKDAGVLALNPPGRAQTKKHRPTVPVPSQFIPWLDEAMGRDNYLPVSSIRHSWEKMRKYLKLPANRQSGEKLIRRSVATIARPLIGERDWVQGEMMMGHKKATISDIYALPDPAHFGRALEVTEVIIDDIEKLCPGAYRKVTAEAVGLRLVK
ncbi:hypothetical protein [Sphingopyxis witflariensis]|uniref:Integrase n=1 Tax=Sphingopyxis witflariensis TaxID=173675 RepID=A0A246JYV4_9SPHN|nr:hypothetical protein [Sphingopyxis witflariensis]OWQ98358.1 hypothetical protein CDQ91_07645 [Sphingopyxis witflariensis]